MLMKKRKEMGGSPWLSIGVTLSCLCQHTRKCGQDSSKWHKSLPGFLSNEVISIAARNCHISLYYVNDKTLLRFCEVGHCLNAYQYKLLDRN